MSRVMAQLAPNHLVIRKALNGPRAVYGIAKHPRLFLAADGKGSGSWRIRYRPGRGLQQRWHTISNDARNSDFEAVARKAKELLARLALDGVDPKAPHRQVSPTFDEAFGSWLERHAKAHKKSWSYDRELYRRHVESRLGRDAFAKIDRQRVIAVLDDIAASATPIQANRAQALISAVFSWGVDEGLVTAHPALRIRRRGAEIARDLVMDDHQLRAFWAKLGDAEGHIGCILKLLLLLGCRRGELLGIEVRELTFGDRPQWSLPGSRSKNGLGNVVPLPPLALSLMRGAIAGNGGSRFVFPARNLADRPFDERFVSRACKRLYRDINVPQMRLHDLRHQAATGMAMCGVPMEIRQLVQNQVTGRRQSIGAVYDQHDYFDEKLRALSLWERRLAVVTGQSSEALARY